MNLETYDTQRLTSDPPIFYVAAAVTAIATIVAIAVAVAVAVAVIFPLLLLLFLFKLPLFRSNSFGLYSIDAWYFSHIAWIAHCIATTHAIFLLVQLAGCDFRVCFR